MSTALIVIVLGALILGLILGASSILLKGGEDSLVEKINAVLPQTQCGQCGYPGCKPYATAIAEGDAINKCPPGGEEGIKALAELLGKDVIPLDEEHGIEAPTVLAFIREDECIGCTKCIQACPVDAILGSAKHMHTVIASECTGCKLCVPPCPVDCIDLIEESKDIHNWTWPNPEAQHKK